MNRSKARLAVRFAVPLGLAFATLVTSVPAFAAPSTARPRAFLRVELPKRSAFVGESIPVTIRAYYLAGADVTLTASPKLSDDDFTLKAGEPKQGHEVVGGAEYLVVTWKDRLSPVKAGTFTVGASVPSTLEWRSAVTPDGAGATTTERDPFGSDPFGALDPQSLFGGGDPLLQMQKQMQRMMSDASQDLGVVHREDVVLRAPATALTVSPLPLAGQPPAFSGAVGRFAIVAHAEPTSARTGEPVTLSLRVSGEGNFDRVSVGGVVDSGDWKTYSPTASDGDGEKTFRQPIVPLHPGPTTIPAVAFSYFDPGARAYTTVRTEPIAIDVAPGAALASGSDGRVPQLASGPRLAPNADAPGHLVASLAPVFLQRWFWEVQGIPLLGVGSAFLFMIWRRRNAADPDRPRRRESARAVRRRRGEMDRALERRDTIAFFAAARGALQERLGARWHLEPAAITLAEIKARVSPDDDLDTLRTVFDADAVRFSGAAPDAADLPRWKTLVDRQLTHQETP